jgi:Ras-related GTP-binding protein A/B
VVLFERTTFLVIARSGTTDDEDEEDDGVDVAGGDGEHHDPNALNPKRFEKISELVKMFKVSCR